MGPAATMGPAPLANPYAPPYASVFRERDFAWSTEPGSASIVGAVGYRNGPVRYSCSGEDVILTPETAWSRRRMIILYGSDFSAAVPVGVVRSRIPSAPNGDYVRFVRKAKCDGDNHFTFTNLPDGSWFVITVAKPADPGADTVALMRRVQTRGGRRFVSLN